jgi:hypothetical protein
MKEKVRPAILPKKKTVPTKFKAHAWKYTSITASNL